MINHLTNIATLSSQDKEKKTKKKVINLTTAGEKTLAILSALSIEFTTTSSSLTATFFLDSFSLGMYSDSSHVVK